MPTRRRQKLLREEDAIRRALESLGGEQSIDSIREWIQTNVPELYDERRIGTLLRGYSDLQKARTRHPEFGPAFLERTRQGHFKLACPGG
jgi:hypothetical protein